MNDIPVVDPHFHIWDITNNNYPWLVERPLKIKVAGEVDAIANDYLITDYLTEVANQNVVKAVHIDAGWNYEDSVSETRWLQSVADTHGFPHGIVARTTLEKPDVKEVLEQHSTFKNIRGIRQILNWHADPEKTYIKDPALMLNPAWRKGFALLSAFDLSFDLQIYPSQMDDAAALAAEFDTTQIILNHTGMPADKDAEGLAQWRNGIRQLAERETVSIKLSGLGMLDWNWTTASIRPFILEAIEAFGPSRAMFASNFPVDRLYSSYDTLFNAFHEIVSDFSESEKSALFHDTAERIYRL